MWPVVHEPWMVSKDESVLVVVLSSPLLHGHCNDTLHGTSLKIDYNVMHNVTYMYKYVYYLYMYIRVYTCTAANSGPLFARHLCSLVIGGRQGGGCSEG